MMNMSPYVIQLVLIPKLWLLEMWCHFQTHNWLQWMWSRASRKRKTPGKVSHQEKKGNRALLFHCLVIQLCAWTEHEPSFTSEDETGMIRISKRKGLQWFPREFWLRGHFNKMDSCPCLISIKCSILSCENGVLISCLHYSNWSEFHQTLRGYSQFKK